MNRLAFVDQWRAGNLPAEAILDLTPVAIYATDADGRITYFNEPSVALWGARPVLGETMWCGSLQIFLPGRHAGAARSLPDGGLPCRKPADRRHRTRSSRAMTASAGMSSSIRGRCVGADGSLRGAVNTLIDVTERRAGRTGAQPERGLCPPHSGKQPGLHQAARPRGQSAVDQPLRLHQPGDRRSRPGDRPQLFRFLEGRGTRRCPGGCGIRTPDRLRTLHRHLSRAARAASRCGTR